MLYLDHAATTPVRAEAIDAMMPFLTERFGNASSHHTVGEAAASALADARARVAAVLGMRAGDVVFTAGGSEANNLAIKGIALGRSRESRHLVVSPIEHESVLACVDYLERVHDYEVTRLAVDHTGVIDPASIREAVRGDTALVSVGYANNEIGTVQDVVAVSEASGRVPLHVDAVQAAGWLPLRSTGADALSLAGHKFGAPQGTGVLAVRGRIPLEPVIHGGGQERGRRSGTENVAGAVALAVALELAEAEREERAHIARRETASFIARVLELVPEAALTGHPTRRLPATASFTFAGTSGEAVLLELERRGVVSSSGSACAAGSDEPSHVLVALGIDRDIARTSVRFTLGHVLALPPGALAGPIADAVAASVAAVRSGA